MLLGLSFVLQDPTNSVEDLSNFATGRHPMIHGASATLVQQHILLSTEPQPLVHWIAIKLLLGPNDFSTGPQPLIQSTSETLLEDFIQNSEGPHQLVSTGPQSVCFWGPASFLHGQTNYSKPPAAFLHDPIQLSTTPQPVFGRTKINCFDRRAGAWQKYIVPRGEHTREKNTLF